MDVSTAISQRCSVRAYKATDLEEDKLSKIVEAARLSPLALKIGKKFPERRSL